MRVLLAAALATAMLGESAQHRTVTITIDGTAFAPPEVTVGVGDTVTWVNRDPFPHTATSRGHFDSRQIAAGGSWTYRATQKGDFAYICRYHPTMVGTLHVK